MRMLDKMLDISCESVAGAGFGHKRPRLSVLPRVGLPAVGQFDASSARGRRSTPADAMRALPATCGQLNGVEGVRVGWLVPRRRR